MVLEAQTVLNPRISVLFPAILGFASAETALACWNRQAHQDQFEILILFPQHLGPSPEEASRLPRNWVLIPYEAGELHQVRALGVDHARGEYVVLAEDHCVPDPDWMDAMLSRTQEGWDGIGCALRAGNREGCWPEASFLIGYGEWMMPVQGGPSEVLCGWNGTIRTERVRQFGKELAAEMLMGAFLVKKLKDQGCRFYLEERARMRHFDPDGFSCEMFLLFLVGLGFGAKRTVTWSLPLRWLYPLGVPIVAMLHWKRAYTHFRRAGIRAGMGFDTLAAALVLACAWALGEGCGAVLGPRRVGHHLWQTEVKPVSREDEARSTAQEAAHGVAGLLRRNHHPHP